MNIINTTSLNPEKSPGPNGIHPTVLFEARHELSHAYTYYF